MNIEAEPQATAPGSRAKWIENWGSEDLRKTANPRRVLVVEDNLDSVHSMVMLVRSMGHVVDFAINGYAAVFLARQMRPQLVFLDLGLPGLDGFEVCRRIKADPVLSQARVVAVTGCAQVDYEHRAREAGAEAFFRKPLSISVLEDLLS